MIETTFEEVEEALLLLCMKSNISTVIGPVLHRYRGAKTDKERLAILLHAIEVYETTLIGMQATLKAMIQNSAPAPILCCKDCPNLPNLTG